MIQQQKSALTRYLKKEDAQSFVKSYIALKDSERAEFIYSLVFKEDTESLGFILKSLPQNFAQEAIRNITPKCFELDSVKLLLFVLGYIKSNDEDFFLASVKKKAYKICQHYLDNASLSAKNTYCLWLQKNITNKEFGKTCQELICKIESQEINSHLEKSTLSTPNESKPVLKI